VLVLCGGVFLTATSLLLPWTIALPAQVLAVAACVYGWKRMPLEWRRTVSEQAFIIISGAAALAIVAVVLYLLIHIFLMGRSHLSLDFIFQPPSQGMTGGGIFPAIIGTALLVIIMSLAGVPVGTITAIYLSEYARETSVVTRFIRFAVNTLAGVPAIVFGLFGLGFFIGTIGRQMDNIEHGRQLDRMEKVFVSQGASAAPDGKATAAELRAMLERDDPAEWEKQIALTRVLEETRGTGTRLPMDEVRQFFAERTSPHWGQPALIWAALTMALLTLPVVIVSVEEAIKTVPRELREASLALGATKWMTIVRVVLPGSLPGILTGGILAVSRGAGEVAPILFTGAAYFLPDLPDALSSQFMELGYHIYILATQSPDVELTKPLQYATTFVLLILTFTLNFSAIFLRSKIRRRMIA
jgi:ABC-type phosphate transport system permease subunit